MLRINKTGVLSAVFAILFAFSMPAVAGEDYGGDVTAKLSRGVVNTATGWVEIPKNVINESNKSNAAVGLTWGLIKGVFHTVGRTAVGVVELVTFFIPNDEFVHPTYAWDPMEEDTTYGSD